MRNKPLGLANKKDDISGGSKWLEKQRKTFFDDLGVQLGYKSMEDWYNVKAKDIQNNGGGGLLTNYYRNSPSEALQSVYPEHNWMLWKFKTVPMGYWERP